MLRPTGSLASGVLLRNDSSKKGQPFMTFTPVNSPTERLASLAKAAGERSRAVGEPISMYQRGHFSQDKHSQLSQ